MSLLDNLRRRCSSNYVFSFFSVKSLVKLTLGCNFDHKIDNLPTNLCKISLPSNLYSSKTESQIKMPFGCDFELATDGDLSNLELVTYNVLRKARRKKYFFI